MVSISGSVACLYFFAESLFLKSWLSRNTCAGMVLLAGVCAVFGLAMLVPAAEAQATTYRLRVQTVGRATQFYRSDRRVAAPRSLTQMLSLSAFDLGNDQSGKLSAQLSVRYFSDFGLEQRLRNDPMFGDRWNATTLDLAYVNWRPFEALHLRLGRQ